MKGGVGIRTGTYAGVGLVTLATLMYEILLTRIFSVTMWYHFAFVAISVAMFGMTVGAILVYLSPRRFPEQQTHHHLALSSLLFALSIVISFLTHLSIPFAVHPSLTGLYIIALTYAVISVPFVFSGICVCLALTRFPAQVSRLYAADLTGGALGCVLLVGTLRITDGPTAVIVVALFAGIGAVCFSSGASSPRLTRWALISCLVLGSFAAAHTLLVHRQLSLLRLVWVRGQLYPRPLYEKWNSFSYIRVTGDPSREKQPLGWGISKVYPSTRKVRELDLDIDTNAATVLTAFDGDFARVEHLKYDVTNIAHYLRPRAKVLVVGTGGGRDILSALAFGQKQVLGVEINDQIIRAVNGRFGDFTGHLDRRPEVTFVNDEARSYIARLRDRFDILQISLIDTWAATAAGAFVLSESSLYTVEAWRTFLDHLTPGGVLSVSRWYSGTRPDEMYRLTALASTSLAASGVVDPRRQIAIVRAPAGEKATTVGTLLVGKQPFSPHDLDVLEGVARSMGFDLVLSPRFSLDGTFARIASGNELDAFTAAYPLNIAAPTDDSPFFFHMLRPRSIFSTKLWTPSYVSPNMRAVLVLGALLFVVLALTSLCILLPLILTRRRLPLRGTLPLLVFFASIGLGFMLVEVSQMQRLIIFLGHPVYGLSVVLFALLLSSGLGSHLTARVGGRYARISAVLCLILLLCALVVFGILTPRAAKAFQGSETPIRILVASGTLLSLGTFMGMAFPLGMKIASRRSSCLTPWLWGVNGATSVCASVAGVAISLGSSISRCFWTGFVCYLAAFMAFCWASSGERP